MSRAAITLFEIEHGDRFLLCSDGLDKHLKDPEIERFLADGDPEQVARALVDTTLERGAVDNVTVCVVEMSER